MSDTTPNEDFRSQVERLVAEGKLTAEEAAGLLHPAEEDSAPDFPTPPEGPGTDRANLHLEISGYTLQVVHDPHLPAPQLNATRPEELMLEATPDGWKVSRTPGHRHTGWSDLRAILTVPFQPQNVRGLVGGGSLNLPALRGEAHLKIGGGSVTLHSAHALNASIGGGSLKAGAVHGGTQLTIGGGSARIEEGRALNATVAGGSLAWQGHLSEGQHTVTVAGGSARLDLAPGSSVTLNGQATAGNLKADFPTTRTGQFATHRYHGVLGGGSATLNVRVTGGSVALYS